jgi:predicted GIY-YIG superfamily endonuclease
MLTCYLITNIQKTRTYIGATKDFTRRLKQHNRILKGGAKSTSGEQWDPIILVTGFNTWSEALSFEWHWKHTKTPSKISRLDKRINSLNKNLESYINLTIHTNIELAPYIFSDNIKELSPDH